MSFLNHTSHLCKCRPHNMEYFRLKTGLHILLFAEVHLHDSKAWANILLGLAFVLLLNRKKKEKKKSSSVKSSLTFRCFQHYHWGYSVILGTKLWCQKISFSEREKVRVLDIYWGEVLLKAWKRYLVFSFLIIAFGWKRLLRSLSLGQKTREDCKSRNRWTNY